MSVAVMIGIMFFTWMRIIFKWGITHWLTIFLFKKCHWLLTQCCKGKIIWFINIIVWFLCEQKIFISNDYISHFILPTASLSKDKRTTVLSEKSDFFIQLHFQRTACKKCLFMRDIIISSWCLGERWTQYTCAVSSGWIPWVWCLRADVAAELRSLRRYYHLSNGMESKSVDTRSIYRELGATLSYNMRLGNGMEMNPGWRRLCAKNFVDDNRVKVNNDGNFVNDLSGRRGIYQAAIKASFSSTFSGHLGVGYSHGAGVESPWKRWLVWTGRSDHQIKLRFGAVSRLQDVER